MSRKEKMKIYHGIPKSVTDEHTTFYIDFDEDIPNIYYEDSRYKTIRGYKDSNTGLSTNRVIILPVGNFDLISNPFTIDVWVENIVSGSTSDEWGNLVGLGYIAHVENFVMKKIFSLVNASYKTPNTITGIGTSIIPNSYLKTDEPIHLRVAYDGDKTIRGYVNGQKVNESIVNETELLNYQGIKEYFLGINIGHNYQVTRNNCYVSEFHISDIDRGDYFPNLPQDFIDGKAIIKPRMNQQQIKGDPLYSQETTNIVKIGTNVNEPQITCSRTTGNWTSSDTIKVKGLNGEVISGVIDTDTALCRGIKYVKEGTDAQLQVDDVSKLAVNDIVRFIRVTDFMIGKEDIKITAIDPLTNIITLSGTGSTYNNSELALGWNLIVEATATSSSPIVKPEDGTTVVGTWSGLGTNEATFTLGDNTDLSGKDLYVTYSLNIPSGNSDFSELPYSVDKAYNETGLEMKPVSEIVIEDDFKGKVQGDTKICPHVTKYAGHTSLKLPQEFSAECNQVNINDISTTDGSCGSIKMASPGIPQQLFSFNLIEVVERKLGCEIPSRDKVQWLKDNIINYTCTAYGNGTNPLGNKYILNNYCFAESRWYGDPKVHFQSQISEVYYTQISPNWIAKSIDSKGYTHFIVYTDTSDGVTPSYVYTDYIKIEVKLKVDSTFITLYCDNKRAREDKCNPVLIQKETKTVKRYVPSKECFVTECSYTNPGFESRSLTDYANNNIYSRNFGIISTSGTDINNVSVRNPYRNLIANLGIDELIGSEYSEETLSEVSTSSDPLPVPLFIKRVESTTYPGNNYWLIPEDVPKNINSLIYCDPRLNKINGEIYLYLYCAKYKNGVLDVSTQPVGRYKLPNRPLIK